MEDQPPGEPARENNVVKPDEEGINGGVEDASKETGSTSSISQSTAEKLEKVKDIIEKPEERWRILWQTSRNVGGGGCDTPSSASSR